MTNEIRRPPKTQNILSNQPLILLTIIYSADFDFLLFEHRCTKNQSLQVFGRIEQEFNGSETLQVSSPKFIFRGSRLWVASASPISEK